MIYLNITFLNLEREKIKGDLGHAVKMARNTWERDQNFQLLKLQRFFTLNKKDFNKIEVNFCYFPSL